MNDVFMAMIFGFGMPLLFPIVALSLCIHYVVQVACLYYSYKLPPSYDREISDWVYSILLWAPVFLLSFGYWMISSLQLNSNEYLTILNRASDTMPSQHTVMTALQGVGWESPKWAVIGALCFILPLIVFKNAIFPLLKSCLNLKDDDEDVHVLEHLPNYWYAIHGCQMRWLI